MATWGSTSNPAEYAFAWDGVYNQFATRMTVPTVSSGVVKIQRVHCWLAGYLSATTHKMCVWDNDSNRSLLTKSDGFTPTVRSFDNGNSDYYDKNVTNIQQNSGAQVWVGFAYNPNGQTQFDCTDNTGSAYAAVTHIREKSTTWPSALDSPNWNYSWRLCVSYTYEEVILDPEAYVRRSSNWDTKPEWYVRRSSSWSGVDDEVYVYRSSAWTKA